MEDDWDLHAVVRGCISTTATATATATAASSFSTNTESHLFSTPPQDFNFSAAWVEDPFEPRRETFTEELHDLYKPFFRCPPEPSQTAPLSSRSLRISPLSVLGGLQDLSSSEQLHQQVVKELPQQTQIQPFSLVSVSKAGAAQNPSSRSKKRKNHLKRVCHVPAERLSSDVWSWRKYGQKPIKGSPYPRGYYKCSTLKGCPARKQVERNKSDPGMFIVTYTGDHNHPTPTHRNSLAGSTRQKNPNSDDPNRASEVSPAESLSPTPEKLDSSREDLAEAENDDDDDDEFSVSNMPLDDDFFMGLEDFTSQDGGDCESGRFPADAQFPCLANSMTPTAGGGG